jgi:hypothetical protein
VKSCEDLFRMAHEAITQQANATEAERYEGSESRNFARLITNGITTKTADMAQPPRADFTRESNAGTSSVVKGA